MRSPSAVALACTGLLAIVQAILFACILAEGRNASHLVDVSGQQRMQSQRVAYLTLLAHTGVPEARWRPELDRVLAMLSGVRAELDDAKLSSERRYGDGRTALERLVDQYTGAARTLERDPSNAAAYATIGRLRLPLLAASDASVKGRVADLRLLSANLIRIIGFELVVQLILIVAIWARVAAPQERRIGTLMRAMAERDQQLRSLFDENPDAIAIFDENGFLVRTNRARGLGDHHEGALVGLHYSTFAQARVPGTVAAFEAALRGKPSTMDLSYRGSEGEVHDVRTTFFANVVAGIPKGAIVVSKDMRALKLAERAYAEQSQRLADLYAIAAVRGKSMRERVGDALAIAAQHLEYEWAAVTEITGEAANVISTYGDPSGATIKAHEGLHRSVVGHLANADDVWALDDAADAPWIRGLTGNGWQAMCGMRVEADGVLYGAVAFASDRARTAALSESDRHFLRLVAALLANIMERDRRERKLDSLAFFDALTGLPNRVLLLDRLEELSHAARQRNAGFALFSIDLDRFKDVNDTHGHGAGDAVLRAVATRLQQCVREGDTVARLSGDEFVVVQARTTGVDDLARRIVEGLSQPIRVKNVMLSVGASVGIAVFPDDAATALDLLAASDRALYHAKRTGRNRHALASDLEIDGTPKVVNADDQPGIVTPLRRKSTRRRRSSSRVPT